MAPSQSAPLTDAEDRGQRLRRVGSVRLQLSALGFMQCNRGGMGCSGHHAHEVAHDCLQNKVKLFRYDPVCVVRIPDKLLVEFREVNKHKCATDPFMPLFSPSMVYGLLMKTHFTHACKLAKDGGRTLYNQGTQKLTFAGEEWGKILEQGVLCVEYESELLDDDRSLKCVMSQDNLNAAVQMLESEVQAF